MNKAVLVTLRGGEVDLRRQVGARIFLTKHRQGRELRVAQVVLGVSALNPRRKGRLVAAACPHAIALFTHHDGGPGVLTARQDATRRDGCVLEQLTRHEAVVVARLRVLEDIGEASKVRRSKQMRDVPHRLLSEQRQRRRVDLEDGLPIKGVLLYEVTVEAAVRGVVSP